MLHGFHSAATQYAIGGSPHGQRMARTVGYEPVGEYPAMMKILRPLHRLRSSDVAALRRLAWASKDMGRFLRYQHEQRPRRSIRLRPVPQFGPETDNLLATGPTPLVLTTRSAELLNYYVRYPGAAMSGWLIEAAGRPAGVALLNVVAAGGLRRGKIVECFLANRDEDLWHATLAALTNQLCAQGADTATCYASTPWVDRACRRLGFRPQRQLETFYLRDRGRLVPRDAPFHLTLAYL